MADKTGIQWTNATWNPITGCEVVSPGCTNCYAMKLAGTRLQHHPSRAGLTRSTKAGPVWTGEVRFNEQWLDQPLRWRRPRRIFVVAHGDLFHEKVPDEWLDEIFAVMALAPQHTFQVLTKRPERMRAYLTAPSVGLRVYSLLNDLAGRREVADPSVSAANPQCWPLPNVWLGTSVEDQKRADERIPILLDIPAAVRWLSCEPLLGTINLTDMPGPARDSGAHGWSAIWKNNGVGRAWIDWVIVGGESGPGARPMDNAWAESLLDQCARSGVPFFCKQLSVPGTTRVLHDLEDFPPALRVRQYPVV